MAQPLPQRGGLSELPSYLSCLGWRWFAYIYICGKPAPTRCWRRVKAPVTPFQRNSFVLLESVMRVADPESTKIRLICLSQAPKRCSTSAGVSQSRIEAPGWGSAGAGDGSGNHQAGFTGVGTSRNSSAKRKGHHTALRMLKTRRVRAGGHWTAPLERSEIPDTGNALGEASAQAACLSGSYSSLGLFDPEINSEQTFWCCSDSPTDLLLSSPIFQVICSPSGIFQWPKGYPV